MAVAVATKVKGDVRTHAPAPIPQARIARCRASVPEARATACRTPRKVASSSSSARTLGPRTTWPLSRTPRTASSIACRSRWYWSFRSRGGTTMAVALSDSFAKSEKNAASVPEMKTGAGDDPQHRHMGPHGLTNTCKIDTCQGQRGWRRRSRQGGSPTGHLEVSHQRLSQGRDRVLFGHDIAGNPMPGG